MSRIIAGTAGGTNLLSVPGTQTRPTTDRTKEALFSWLESRGWLENTRVLDLYAGSGALGAEAASRGAAEVIGVEKHRKTASIATKNTASVNRVLGEARCRIVTGAVQSYLQTQPENYWDLILADPPYDVHGEELATMVTSALYTLMDDGLFVLERSQRSEPPELPSGYDIIDDRTYGEARLFFIRPVSNA